MPTSHLIYSFSEIDKEDSASVGAEGVKLGEMKQAGILVPEGFILSSDAYLQYLKENNLTTKINHLLETVNFTDAHSLLQVAAHIRKQFMEGTISESVTRDIITQYYELSEMQKDIPLVLTSSPTTPTHSSLPAAGHQQLFPVTGETALLLSIKELWASLFEAKAIFYRHEHHFEHFRIGSAIIIQRLILAEVSGRYYSQDPLTDQKNTAVIEAIHGLWLTETEKFIYPDRYEVDKKTGTVTQKVTNEQSLKHEMVGHVIHTVQLPGKLKKQEKLTESRIHQIREIATTLENLYYFPLEFTWSAAGRKLYVEKVKHLSHHLPPHPGQSADSVIHTRGIGVGHLRIIHSARDIQTIQHGEIVYLDSLTMALLPALKHVGGIITRSKPLPEQYVAVAAMGIPLVTGIQADILKDGQVITLDARTNEIKQGSILKSREGVLSLTVPDTQAMTATKLYVRVDDTKQLENPVLPGADGVGLLKSLLFFEAVGVHPKKLLRDGKDDAFLSLVAEKLTRVAKAYAPRPILYEVSDLLSSDLRKLTGGKSYEPIESNPLLGYRGGLRMLHDREVFHLELKALQKTRQEGQLHNLHILLPFIRSAEELIRVKKTITDMGLSRQSGCKLYLSIDTPAAVVTLEQYLKVGVDGISLNADNLTMLFSGLDPHNSEVAVQFREDNEAVLEAYRFAIKLCHKYNVPVIITGETLPHRGELLEKFVSWGISGITLEPHGLENIRKTIYKYERRLLR